MTPGHSRPLRAAPGCSRPLQAAPGCSRPLQAAPGRSRPLQATPGHSRPLQAAPGHSRPLKATPGLTKMGTQNTPLFALVQNLLSKLGNSINENPKSSSGPWFDFRSTKTDLITTMN